MLGEIPRNKMPQIKSSLVPAFISELTASGVDVLHTAVQASALSKSQLELHEDNILALMAKPDQLKKLILCSEDNYVLDGHHRWAANCRLGNVQKVFLVKLPAVEALRRMSDFASRHQALCGAKE